MLDVGIAADDGVLVESDGGDALVARGIAVGPWNTSLS